MAFHVACPITCRRICYCTLGFPRKLQTQEARDEFLDEVARVEEFLKDPFLIKARESRTVKVAVPKVVAAPPTVNVLDGAAAGVDGNDLLVSGQTKRLALQKRAAAASLVAEDYARRFESGDLEGAVQDLPGEQQVQSNVKVMCRLCFFGENEGSERAMKMLSCKSCGKKYHRSCLKAWSKHRDLFHWSSWTCPSCRICEVCRRTGDPDKFMFCRRCDGAYHCYCQQPPHKNVGSGPYLCPKHTRCHSCGSTVPGNGLSVRWFLGYTCCDACGRLFVKGNYCPICLKVYRDSESTPMVCCDICQRWVHCQCDGISDEKYLQFQVDRNLQYVCATCRGECYQVRDLEDAVQELWRRRDEVDRDLVASLRGAAGLPIQEEIFSISPYSDEEENGPMISKNEIGRSLKFSLKGSSKKSSENGKKSSSKKYGKKKGYKTSLHATTEASESLEVQGDARSEYSAGDNKINDVLSDRGGEPDTYSSPIAESLTEGIYSINQAPILKHKFINEVTTGNDNRTSRTVKIKSYKTHDLDTLDNGKKHAGKSNVNKGPKLVIHLGARNKNPSTSPRSDGSSCHREQDVATSNGDKINYPEQIKGSKFIEKEVNVIKIKNVSSEASDRNIKFSGGRSADGNESVSSMIKPVGKSGSRVASVGPASEVLPMRNEKLTSLKHTESRGDMLGDTRAVSLPKEPKPLLKLKFKNPYNENQNSWPSQEDEMNFVKGQRSKRKRPTSIEKTSTREDEEASQWYGDDTLDEIMDANWILQKLGKDAIGKRVEVHQTSDNSWHRGTVTEVIKGTSLVAVSLDDGRARNLELGKQGIRFVSQKQRR